MADSSAQDPTAAPMHHEIVERFPRALVWLCGVAGVAAITVGLVLGIVIVND